MRCHRRNALVLCDARITLEFAIDGLLDDAGLFFGNSHVDDLIAFPRCFLTLSKRNGLMLPRIREFSSAGMVALTVGQGAKA